MPVAFRQDSNELQALQKSKTAQAKQQHSGTVGSGADSALVSPPQNGGFMKKHLLVALSLGLLLATASAYAQSRKVVANVPFDFTVAGKTLPAGEYVITRINADDNVLAIASLSQHQTMLAIPNHSEATNASANTKMVFNHRGNRYFLSQIWVEGSADGSEFPQGTLESELALDYPAQKVVLLAQTR
jgi:hypothetical protein